MEENSSVPSPIHLKDYEPVPADILTLLPESIVRKNLVIPLAKMGGVLLAASGKPEGGIKPEGLKILAGCPVELVMAPIEEIAAFIREHYPETQTPPVAPSLFRPSAPVTPVIEPTPPPEVPAFVPPAPTPVTPPPLPPVKEEATVVVDEVIRFENPVPPPSLELGENDVLPPILKKLIEDSVQHRASEVLVELQGKKLLIRQRIRGVLVSFLNHSWTAEEADAILKGMDKWGQIHQVGNVSWLELSLDRCHVVFSRTLHGGMITVRMSPTREKLFSPEAWGMGPHQARLLEGYLGRKQGVLLFCGMDQDDIESNLYACGKRIASPEKHLLCVSDKRGTWDTIGDQLISDGDPQVMEKLLDLSFHHSPDVLLVGPVETRGQFERIFAQALKGTLVLAHTYARDTADALVQLLSMGLPPHLMGSALLGIISQRNLRLLCPHCQSEDSKAKDFIEQLNIPSAMLPPAFYTGKGCDQCLKTGYDRDTNLFEFLEMSDELRSQLEPGLKIESIRTMLKSNGMLTLRQLAIHKAVNGQTALSEVIRVSP